MKIKNDTIESSEIRLLLQEHHKEMLKYSPVESVHALDLSSLETTDISFWTVWINDELAGCGALKKLTEKHAELKSMRTVRQFLRKGVASHLLSFILEEAKTLKFSRISLETGSANAFIPALSLYESFGFQICEPFSDYKKDPYSLFMTKLIS